ncbi:hypothetical protein B0T26DRAFT_218767 [Lasiosphaeria miniovina]|uniref:Uncharacterized protein n=1 Tax=Lasiosphaeria miniovina TaxID=1954250 RepID=A0AA40AUU5_9PEZI|nr:uncharacterized protein B0T26DRAFT_218767 [Lasiosphaeria miniovina]KAK0722425.1 hypothetical protein B0T26DRAFT_218767 [Lasiosphaeria miniovina]
MLCGVSAVCVCIVQHGMADSGIKLPLRLAEEARDGEVERHALGNHVVGRSPVLCLMLAGGITTTGLPPNCSVLICGIAVVGRTNHKSQHTVNPDNLETTSIVRYHRQTFTGRDPGFSVSVSLIELDCAFAFALSMCLMGGSNSSSLGFSAVL